MKIKELLAHEYMRFNKQQIDEFAALTEERSRDAFVKHGVFPDSISEGVNVIIEELLEFVQAVNDYNARKDNGERMMHELVDASATLQRFYLKHGAIKNGRIPCLWTARNRKDDVPDGTD